MLINKGHMGGDDFLAEISQSDLEKLEKVFASMGDTIIIGSEIDIPNKLKYWRNKRGYSLMFVEKEIGISNAYLSQLETGKIKKPSFNVIVRLCKVYKIRLVIN